MNRSINLPVSEVTGDAVDLVHDRSSLLNSIGNTPLIHIRNLGRDFPNVGIYAKAEWLNPGGSVKDRAALSMILEGERSGKLNEGKAIIDATSGNTGIAYAMIGAILGYEVLIALPANASPERMKILEAYGARLILTDPLEGTDGAQKEVRKVVIDDPERYFCPDQYNNPANWGAHYIKTAMEILEQTSGSLTHFVAGLGTSGTFVGVSRRLKEFRSGIQCISCQPDSPLHGIEGLKHMQSALVPGIYDPTLADKNLVVSTEEAVEMVRLLSSREGLFVGTSSGAAMVASLKVARTLSKGTIVTVFPDSGDKYLSEMT